MTFLIRTATRDAIHHDLGPAIASARNAVRHGHLVLITADRREWWTLTNNTHWQLQHFATFASLFDTTLSTRTTWHNRALELLARLDNESASTTNKPNTNHSPTMEVNAS